MTWTLGEDFRRESLKKNGVLLVHLMYWTKGHEHCVAINAFNGNLVYEGHPLWVCGQLAKEGTPIKAEYGPQSASTEMTT